MGTFFVARDTPRSIRVVDPEKHQWLFTMPLNDTKPRLETVCWAHRVDPELAKKLTKQACETADFEARQGRLF